MPNKRGTSTVFNINMARVIGGRLLGDGVLYCGFCEGFLFPQVD